MRIRHKETNIERSLSFGEWIREYVRKELYKDWEVLHLDDVFKVQTLFNETGRTSVTLMSGNDARNHKNKSNGVSVNILKEPVTMEFY